MKESTVFFSIALFIFLIAFMAFSSMRYKHATNYVTWQVSIFDRWTGCVTYTERNSDDIIEFCADGE